MMALCVTPADNNQYLAFDGNVLSAQTMTFVLSVIMEISTI